MNGMENDDNGRDDNTTRVIKALTDVLQHVAADAQEIAAKCNSDSDRAKRRDAKKKIKKLQKAAEKKKTKKEKKEGEEGEEGEGEEDIDAAAATTSGDERIYDPNEWGTLMTKFKPYGLEHKVNNGTVHAYRLDKIMARNGKHFNERTSYEWPSFGTHVRVVAISAHDSYVYMLLHDANTDEDEHCIYNMKDPVFRLKTNDHIFYGFVGDDLAVFLRRYKENSIHTKVAAALNQSFSDVMPGTDIAQLASFVAPETTTPLDAIDRTFSVYPLSGKQMVQCGAQDSGKGERTPPTGSLHFYVPVSCASDILCQSHVICINRAVSLSSAATAAASTVDETIWYLFPNTLAVSHFGRTFTIFTKVELDGAAHIQRSNLGVVVFATDKAVKYANVYQMVTYPSSKDTWVTAIWSRTFYLDTEMLKLDEVTKYTVRIEMYGSDVMQCTDTAFIIATHENNNAEEAKRAHNTTLPKILSRFSGHHAGIVFPVQNSNRLGLMAILPRQNSSSTVATFELQVEAITQEYKLKLGNIFKLGDPVTTLGLACCVEKPGGETSSGYFDVQRQAGEHARLRLEWTSTPHGCISHFVTTSTIPLYVFNRQDVFYGQSVTAALVTKCNQLGQIDKEAGSRQSQEGDLQKLRRLYETALKEKQERDNANRDHLKTIAELTAKQLVGEENDKKAARAKSTNKKLKEAAQSIDQKATIAYLNQQKNALHTKFANIETELQQLKQTTSASAAQKEQYIQSLQKELGNRAEQAKQAAEKHAADIHRIKQQHLGAMELEQGALTRKLTNEFEKCRKAAAQELEECGKAAAQELEECRKAAAQELEECRKAAAQELEECRKELEDCRAQLTDAKKTISAFSETEELYQKLQDAFAKKAAVPPSPINDNREHNVVSPSLSGSSTISSQYLDDIARYRQDAQQYRADIQEMRNRNKDLETTVKSLKDEMESRGRIIAAIRQEQTLHNDSRQQLLQANTNLQQQYTSLQQMYFQEQSSHEEMAANYYECYAKYSECYAELGALKQQQSIRVAAIRFPQQTSSTSKQNGQQMHPQRRDPVASSLSAASAAPPARAPTVQTTQQPLAPPAAGPTAVAE
jgi:hypothetical protein